MWAGPPPWSRGAMDIDSTDSWVQRPGPAIAVGIALLVVCAGFAALWFTSDLLLARPAGLLTGSAGLYLLYGGLVGRREGR